MLSKRLNTTNAVTNAALNARHKYLIQKTKFDTEVKKFNDKIALNSSGVPSTNI